MHRHAIDRWTDTTAFRVTLLLAGLVVVPVLAMGVLTTLIGGSITLLEHSAVDLEQALFALLSVGGALGFIGYGRARSGARRPDRHNVTATLLCLAAGVIAALGVAVPVAAWVVEIYLVPQSPWNPNPNGWATLLALFSFANAVWAIAGIGWMQRLLRRYAEDTRRVFDGLPALLLFVALVLATAATTMTTTL